MLEFLKIYDSSIEIVSHKEIGAIESIPEVWKNIFYNQDKNTRIQQVIQLWEKYLKEELKETIDIFKKELYEITLVKRKVNGKTRYSMIYILYNQEEEYIYYEGRNPKENHCLQNNMEYWDKLPKSLRDFYENIHDGFYHYCNRGMGLQPIGNIHFMEHDNEDEDLWNLEYEDELEDVEFDEETDLSFYWNNIGIALSINSQECDINNAILWRSTKGPKNGYNFWNIVDKLLLIF